MLERVQRIALARILSDLIEADFIVEEKEMDFFEETISKDGFNISESMLIEAKRMDFAKAMSILKELDGETREELVKTLKRLSLSDGTCVPLEAVLIYCVIMALTENANVFSVPSEGINMENMTTVYVENTEGTDIDAAIRNQLKQIEEEFANAGFDFIYIPSVVDDFRALGKKYLHKVVKYMIPSASTLRIDEICYSLCNLSTSRFCRDLLYKKIGVNLIDSNPSLLIKINESDIIDSFGDDDAERTRFSNFLQIELTDDVMNTIHRLVNTYREMINADIVAKRRSRSNKFLYFGFHRSLFDLIAYGKEKKDCRLVFDFSTHTAKVYFESMDCDERFILKLNPQEAALYMMIVRKSLEGNGLDWREHIPKAEKKKLLGEYNNIYSYIGKGNIVNKYKDRTQTHHIKTRIKVMSGLANAEMFIPEHVKCGLMSFYRIKAPKEYVTFILPKGESSFPTL